MDTNPLHFNNIIIRCIFTIINFSLSLKSNILTLLIPSTNTLTVPSGKL